MKTKRFLTIASFSLLAGTWALLFWHGSAVETSTNALTSPESLLPGSPLTPVFAAKKSGTEVSPVADKTGGGTERLAAAVGTFSKLQAKAIMTDEEVKQRQAILSDITIIDAASNALIEVGFIHANAEYFDLSSLPTLNAVASKLPGMKEQAVHLMLVDLLSDAVTWRENPIVHHVRVNIEQVVLEPLPEKEDSFDATSLRLDPHRNLLGDRVELIFSLMKENEEYAFKVINKILATPDGDAFEAAAKNMGLHFPQNLGGQVDAAPQN